MATPTCFLGPFAWNLFPFLYPEVMSISMLRCISWLQWKGRPYFWIHSINLCLFVGELRPWMLSYQWAVSVDFCYGFPPLWFAGLALFIPCVFLGEVDLFSTFCRILFVDIYCLYLVLSWNVFLSPSTVIESLTACRSVGWGLWFLWICTFVQPLLAFRISIEKSGVAGWYSTSF